MARRVPIAQRGPASLTAARRARRTLGVRLPRGQRCAGLDAAAAQRRAPPRPRGPLCVPRAL